MIRVDDLHYSYPPVQPGSEQWQAALDGVSFQVKRGGCLAVTGRNGCGKTTLCLAAAGLAPRLTGGRLSGQITVAGRDVQAERPGALSDIIGLALENPAGQLFNPTVAAEIAWGLENLGIPPDEIEEQIRGALALTGLENIPWEQPPQTLSGGQQKRLALAAALALHPEVLILDEPAGGLSPAARDEMLRVLRRLRNEQGLTILLTENDPSFITALADQMIVLEAGRVAACEPPRRIYLGKTPAGVMRPPAADFAGAANSGGRADFTCVTAGEAVAQVGQYTLNTNGTAPAAARRMMPLAADKTAITLEEVSFAYLPGQPILTGINLAVYPGEFVALTGDNGAGKTTLARLITGLVRPTKGHIWLFGRDSAAQSIGQITRQVGLAFQSPEVQIFNPTVREELAFGPSNLGYTEDAIREAVDESLACFGLEEIADYPPAALTSGIRRMVALASIEAMQTPILILDEPLVGLDGERQAVVRAWLQKRQAEGTTILLITHDMELAGALAQRLIVLDQGKITGDDQVYRLFARRRLLELAGLAQPFAMQLAEGVDKPCLASDLTPQGAAEAFWECLK